MHHIELLAIGNELLLGLTEERNLSWLCYALTRAGGVVEQATIVGDVAEDIQAAVRGGILRRAGLIITCGGLGPTDDDQTVAVLAHALNRPLEENEHALALVAQRFRELYEAGKVETPDLTPERRKMARLPAGAEPLPNTVGTAPGVLIHVAERTWVCALPGPPRELQPMVKHLLLPRLGDLVPLAAFRERHYRAHCQDESALAPLLRRVAAQHKEVYVKSRAATYHVDTTFRLLLATRAPTPAEAKARLEAAERTLHAVLERAGIALEPTSGGDND
ncbi:MAG: molybdopterin-binding protein [Ardenticatenia bacterium]|nr:molybdopterin-binding protein [Ardenticatenia bacterium]